MEQEHRDSRGNWLAFLLFAVAAACLIGVAAARARTVTASLEWPYDADLFRDIASAQNILQGDWLADPYYARESLWYNPLVPALIAGTSKLMAVPVHRLYAADGWAFNLLVPIALAALVWRVANRWAALASLSVFIFLPSPGVPPWGWASYSPWLFPAVFAQALFYFTLVALDGAFRSERWGTFALSGGLIGLTFLAHSAPALLLGGVLAVEAVRRLLERRTDTSSFVYRASVALAVAAVVSLPLTVSILGRYHLHVLNPSPSSWGFAEASLGELPHLLRGFLTVPGVLGLAGVWWLVSDSSRRTRARVLIGWMLSNLAWLAVMYACQILARLGWSIGTPVPAYHFLFYWRALAAVLAGCGVFALAEIVSKAAARVASSMNFSSGISRLGVRPQRIAVGLTVVAAIGTALLGYPRFVARYDLTVAVSRSEDRGKQEGALRAWNWIRTSTARRATFLAYDDVGLFVVGPAGRKTVAIGPFFSNPYVDRTSRVTARSQMWSALRSGDRARFCGLARPFDVAFVVLGEEHSAEWAAGMSGFLSLAFVAPGVRIWQVTGCVSS